MDSNAFVYRCSKGYFAVIAHAAGSVQSKAFATYEEALDEAEYFNLAYYPQYTFLREWIRFYEFTSF